MYLIPTVIYVRATKHLVAYVPHAYLASDYNCNYHNLETLNDELRTKTEQYLFLFHVNIRSVIKNEDDLIENISAVRFPPEITAITETK